MGDLKVPEQLAGIGVERDYAIAVQVVAQAMHAIEVISRRTCADKDDASSRVDNGSGPCIGAAQRFTRVRRPRLRAGLARSRNGMKGPAQLAGVYVVGPFIARRRRRGFRHSPAEDEKVFVNHSRRGCTEGEPRPGAVEILAQIDTAIVAEILDSRAICGVDSINIAAYR